MARKRIFSEDEDVTSQAGWLFADSFLALMIIFLATISFIPSFADSNGNGIYVAGSGSTGTGTGQIGSIAGTNYAEGLVLAYKDFDAEQISIDMATYLVEKDLAPNTGVLFANIVGGYAGNENQSAGSNRALDFAIALRKAGIPYFINSKIDLGTSNLIPIDTILVRITLSPSGQ